MMSIVMLLAIGSGLVCDLFLGIVHIVCDGIFGDNGGVFDSRAGCQCHSGKDRGNQKFDSIHNYNTLFDNYLEFCSSSLTLDKV